MANGQDANQTMCGLLRGWRVVVLAPWGLTWWPGTLKRGLSPWRKLMFGAESFSLLQGHVEADEAYIGGRRSGGKRGLGVEGKTVVMGLKERRGRLATEVIPNVRKVTLREVVNRKVEKGSIVSTDELMSYGLLDGDGYVHGAAKQGAKEWANYDYRQDVVHHTNHVEFFWKLFKHSVRGTHIHISQKYTQRYLDEFSFR